jgi:hypothetical protein
MWKGEVRDQRFYAQSLPMDQSNFDFGDPEHVMRFRRYAEDVTRMIEEGIEKHYPLHCHACHTRTDRVTDDDRRLPACGRDNCLWSVRIFAGDETPDFTPLSTVQIEGVPT